MDSPERACVVENALRQGTWLTTTPEGAPHQRKPMQPSASSTKPPLERETAPNTQSAYNCQRRLQGLFQIIFMLEFILVKWSWSVIVGYVLEGVRESVLRSDVILCPLVLWQHRKCLSFKLTGAHYQRSPCDPPLRETIISPCVTHVKRNRISAACYRMLGMASLLCPVGVRKSQQSFCLSHASLCKSVCCIVLCRSILTSTEPFQIFICSSLKRVGITFD